MQVLHVIIGLNVGGAESMLCRLVCSFASSTDHNHIVVSLTDEGVVGARLRERGIRVYSLGMRSLIYMPITLIRLIRLIRSIRPDVVQTWMYHSDFIGGLAARLAGSCSVVWNLRSTSIPQGVFSITYLLVRACAILSHIIPDRIICCANSAKLAHVKLGYPEKIMRIIPNGYVFSAFTDELKLPSIVREELGISDNRIVIGVVGRFDPLKGFKNFVTAASLVSERRDDVIFLMVGRGNEWVNAELRGWIKSLGLQDSFLLVGQQADVESYFSAMDVFCLSSVSEGFPNTVVEAMLSGLPCAVTKAGDAADILSDDKFVVSVNDSVALADTLLQICALSSEQRSLLGAENRGKATKRYSIEKIRQKYEDLYTEILRT